MKKLLLVLIISVLTACATPYQSEGLRGGYSEMQLNDNEYVVSFSGNGFTSEERVTKLLLYRCAELTKKKGFNYFVISSVHEAQNNSQFTTPTTVSSSATGYNNGNIYGSRYGGSFNGGFNSFGAANVNTVVTPGSTYNITRYQDAVIIKMFENNKNAPNVFKADSILDSMRGKL